MTAARKPKDDGGIPLNCPDCGRRVWAHKNEGIARIFDAFTGKMTREVKCIGCPCGWIATRKVSRPAARGRDGKGRKGK